MLTENLAYALVQVAHNLGAVAVAGGALFALWPAHDVQNARQFAWLIFLGWGLQIASGALFGVTSLYYYGETPDLSAVALAALAVKVLAAVSGFLLGAYYLRWGKHCSRLCTQRIFKALASLGVIALTAAAFLRWFS
ncbi:MAG: hypothetical protein HXY27_07825 [Hydrogenophilaceae bacterium]|nr:hypothetical protein [Hydrogenophilaceae bacterium]